MLEAELTPKAIVQREGLGRLKHSATSLGIEPTIFQLVAQCLNQVHYHVLPPNRCLMYLSKSVYTGSHHIPAHRLVLSAGSEYFSAMFTSGLREAAQSEVVLQDVDGDALWMLVNYCYTGIVVLC
jgi:hypothetical protein